MGLFLFFQSKLRKMNTETYGSANLGVEFIDDKKGKKLKITHYLKICMTTRLVIMIILEFWAFGMGKSFGQQNRQLEENRKQ